MCGKKDSLLSSGMLDRCACPQLPDHSIVQLRDATHGKQVAPLRGLESTASCVYSCAVLAFYFRLWSASSWGPGLVGSYNIQPGEQSGPILTFSRVPHGGPLQGRTSLKSVYHLEINTLFFLNCMSPSSLWWLSLCTWTVCISFTQLCVFVL